MPNRGQGSGRPTGRSPRGGETRPTGGAAVQNPVAVDPLAALYQQIQTARNSPLSPTVSNNYSNTTSPLNPNAFISQELANQVAQYMGVNANAQNFNGPFTLSNPYQYAGNTGVDLAQVANRLANSGGSQGALEQVMREVQAEFDANSGQQNFSYQRQNENPATLAARQQFYANWNNRPQTPQTPTGAPTPSTPTPSGGETPTGGGDPGEPPFSGVSGPHTTVPWQVPGMNMNQMLSALSSIIQGPTSVDQQLANNTNYMSYLQGIAGGGGYPSVDTPSYSWAQSLLGDFQPTYANNFSPAQRPWDASSYYQGSGNQRPQPTLGSSFQGSQGPQWQQPSGFPVVRQPAPQVGGPPSPTTGASSGMTNDIARYQRPAAPANQPMQTMAAPPTIQPPTAPTSAQGNYATPITDALINFQARSGRQPIYNSQGDIASWRNSPVQQQVGSAATAGQLNAANSAYQRDLAAMDAIYANQPQPFGPPGGKPNAAATTPSYQLDNPPLTAQPPGSPPSQAASSGISQLLSAPSSPSASGAPAQASQSGISSNLTTGTATTTNVPTGTTTGGGYNSSGSYNIPSAPVGGSGTFLGNYSGGGSTGFNPANVRTVDQLPAWSAMVEAQQRNLERNAANMGEQLAVSGGRFSTAFGDAMTDYWTQSGRDQNAILSDMVRQSSESALGRELQERLGLADIDLRRILGLGDLDVRNRQIDVNRDVAMEGYDVQRYGIDTNRSIASMQDATNRYGIDTNRDVSFRGFDVQQAIADLNAQTQRYGYDVQRDTSMAGFDVQRYLGDLQANTSRYNTDASRDVGMAGVDLQRYLGEMQNQLGLGQLDLTRRTSLAQMGLSAEEGARNRELQAALQLAQLGHAGASQLSAQDFQSQMAQYNNAFSAANYLAQGADNAANILHNTGVQGAMGLSNNAVNAATGLWGAENNAALQLFQNQNNLLPLLSQYDMGLRNLGLNAAGNLGQLDISNMMAGGQLGSIIAGLGQNDLARQYQEWMRQQPEYSPYLQYINQGALGYPPVYQPMYNPSQLPGTLGSIGAILGAIPGLINMFRR